MATSLTSAHVEENLELFEPRLAQDEKSANHFGNVLALCSSRPSILPERCFSPPKNTDEHFDIELESWSK